jgi:hypothetical protein
MQIQGDLGSIQIPGALLAEDKWILISIGYVHSNAMSLELAPHSV